MARINDLIRQLEAKDPALANEISREMRALSERRAFGLNFERHTPEQVELPGRPARKGDKVHILPPRGEFPNKENQRIWLVDSISTGKKKVANLIAQDDPDQTCEVPIEDLVVVAEFRDPIYPGLVSTGRVERGEDKPFHTVINGENFHALEALLFTHRGIIDAIYIDPPYNTGARDWKYNNDYVESDDIYRHSKWLAFIERRLLMAKELLNPACSVLIVTIDEKEYLRLGLLLQQVFPSARVQMVTVMTNKKGSTRSGSFSRRDEYVFYAFQGTAKVTPTNDSMLGETGQGFQTKAIWNSLLRRGSAGSSRKESPKLFFPLWVDESQGRIVEVGDAIPLGVDRTTVRHANQNLKAAWPIRSDGGEGRWQVSPDKLRSMLEEGTLKLGRKNKNQGSWAVNYLKRAQLEDLREGVLVRAGKDDQGAGIFEYAENARTKSEPGTIWVRDSHDASIYGSTLLRSMIPGRSFPFPKSLYAVEDSLRFVLSENPGALVLDFFAGSGTTAHAVMRLNRQDGGSRQSISVTNNEVSAEEQKRLVLESLRPGDAPWEELGICDYITKPRIQAAITGRTPEGDLIKGEYKFTDEFPFSDGFEENVEFFTLTYEAPMRVQSNREFSRIAPFLWLRAGSRGRRIDTLANGWDVTDTYGVLEDLDSTDEFLGAMNSAPAALIAYIVTDEDRLFEAVTRDLPTGVEPVRLHQSYLSNFEIDAMRRVR